MFDRVRFTLTSCDYHDLCKNMSSSKCLNCYHNNALKRAYKQENNFEQKGED